MNGEHETAEGLSHGIAGLLQHAAESLRCGQPDAAINALRIATRVEPGAAALHHDIGYLCLQSGRVPEAVVALREAVRLDPGFAQAFLHLGIALETCGDTAGAVVAYRQSVLNMPALAMGHVCLGALLERLGEQESALAAFQSGAAAAPASTWGRIARARALLAVERDTAAEPILVQLLDQQPELAVAREMLASLHADSGRFATARGHYERAIASAPLLAGSYYDLVRCRRITSEDRTLLERMRAAQKITGLTAEARIKLHLAMGKALDDLGDPGAAMQQFDAADELRSRQFRFDPKAFAGRVERLITAFAADRLSGTGSSGIADSSPIFVMGLPRSGTTLVEQILSSHAQVRGGGELPFWTEQGSSWEAVGTQSRDAFAALGNRYLQQLRSRIPSSPRITDKMPLNILWAGLIHQSLPHATLIHCRRSAADTAMSIHRTYFNSLAWFPTGGESLVAMIRAVEKLAAHWRRVLPSDRFIEVDYEQLVKDPAPQIRRLVQACGLAWDDACLHPEHNQRAIRTPSKWQARQPINSAAVGYWRRFEPWLGPLAELVDPVFTAG